MRVTTFKLLLPITLMICLSASVFSQGKKEIDQKGSILSSMHPPAKEKAPPANLKLLPGYKNRSSVDFEGNESGEIWKKGGLKIKYEIGLSQGMAVDRTGKDKYLWYEEQLVNGYHIRAAFTQDKMFIVSVGLDKSLNIWHAANFYTKVGKPEDAGDMRVMALSIIQ